MLCYVMLFVMLCYVMVWYGMVWYGMTGFPSPREGRQWIQESLLTPAVVRFGCSPDVSLQDVGSGWISEPQRRPTGGVGIRAPAQRVRFQALPRRLPPGSRFWLDFRAPERANMRSWNDSCSGIGKMRDVSRPGCSGIGKVRNVGCSGVSGNGKVRDV